MTALSDPIFELRGLSVTRQTAAGNLQVLQDIDLSLQRGQWLALLGPNGSGKSSLLEFMASGGTACSGSVAIVFQDPDDQLIAATVARELTLGRPGLLPDPWLAEFGLEGLADRNPRHLSAGQKQRLTMAVALAAQPELLLCDEVTSLQDSRQAAWLLDRIDRWRRETGGAVISATQCPREVARADRLAVLSQGRIILSGASAQLMERSEVQGLLVDEFVERPADLDRSESIPPARDPVLKLAGVRLDFPAGGGSLAGLDFSLPAGGRLGVTGPSGCGKSTLLASCVGIRPPEAGTVTLNGQVLYQGTRSCLDHGAALLAPQFPEYLFTSATVAGEIRLDPALAVLDPQEVMAAAGLPASLLTRHPHALSSGQCRRLALVLVVLSERPLLLLDEPTAALDRPGRRQILELLERIPSATAVMIASHDREFLAAAGCPIMELNAIGGFPAGPGGE